MVKKVKQLKAPKGFGVLNKYATKISAKTSFSDMRSIAIKKHLFVKCEK